MIESLEGPWMVDVIFIGEQRLRNLLILYVIIGIRIIN